VWRLALEEKGLGIKRSRTRYIEYDFNKRQQVDETSSIMAIKRNEISEIERLK